LESPAKVRALLSQEKVYVRPGFQAEEKKEPYGEAENLRRDMKDGRILTNEYWIRRYRKSDWYPHFVDYWTNQFPHNTEQGLKEGQTKEEIAEALSENAALGFQDEMSKKYGISHEEVWKLVSAETMKRKR
jgi:hypothetical protein